MTIVKVIFVILLCLPLIGYARMIQVKWAKEMRDINRENREKRSRRRESRE